MAVAFPVARVALKFVAHAGEVALEIGVCACPFCLETTAEEDDDDDRDATNQDDSDDDSDDGAFGRQFSEGTESALAFADDVDAAPCRVRDRRPVKGTTGAKPAVKPNQKIHHRQYRRQMEAKSERADRQALQMAKMTENPYTRTWAEEDHAGVGSSTRARRSYHMQRAEAQAAQRVRHPDRQDAADTRLQAERELGAALLSAEALGLDPEAYRILVEMQFRDVTPEDYTLLGRLDESIKPKALERHRVHVLPTLHVRATEDLAGLVAVNDTTTVELPADIVCLVCMGPFELHDELRKLPCDHLYHKECIDEWLERSTKCPTDNQDLS